MCGRGFVNKALLQRVAYNISRWSILSTTAAGSGHPTSCLSAVDLIAVLFFKEMCFDPFDPENPNNDRFILSKGHAAPLLYAVWHELGVISDQEMLSLRKFDSILEGHPTPRFSRSEASTGSLGCGLSIGVGFALAARLRASSARTFV
ncbi:transketolase, partial [bacterium]|nr:transketolase [bacterium]